VVIENEYLRIGWGGTALRDEYNFKPLEKGKGTDITALCIITSHAPV